MKEYIEKLDALECVKWTPIASSGSVEDEFIDAWVDGTSDAQKAIYKSITNLSAADVVGLDAVAEMLYVSCGCDECPCNYGPTDEWLPEVCDLKDECPNPKDKLGCWKQYIKHFSDRPEYLRGAYEREVDHA